MWSVTNVKPVGGLQQESGQILVDKVMRRREHVVVVHLAASRSLCVSSSQ